MAAKTPATGYIDSIAAFGFRVTIVKFSDIDNGDTWASGINGVKYWFHSSTDCTGVTESDGTFTFSSASGNAVVYFLVISRY